MQVKNNMNDYFRKNKIILLFLVSSIALFMHELYRLYIGCPRVLGDCYVDGADKFRLISFMSQYFIFVCLIIFIYRLLRRFYHFLKPKREIVGPCGPIPLDFLEYIKRKRK
jgi:hypothetical protein